MAEQNPQPTLYIITNNHFDQTWRRCWERPFQYHGLTFISYADLEEYYMLDNLELARQHPEYKFEAECTYVVRKFLERHPDRLEELRALIRAGRFAVTGGGEVIVDGNMVLGESLVRNYVDGLLWVENVLGQTTRLAVRNDAFGNPAQLPQILRGCEIAWATGMSYTPALGLYWRGLDGSCILHKTLPTAAHGGGNTKYPPCAACGGSGRAAQGLCPTCQGRGIDPALCAWLPGEVDSAALELFNAGVVWMNPEELLPNPQIIAWANARRTDPLRPYHVRFALEEDLLPLVRPWLDAVDAPPEDQLHPGVELNPNNSGCLVTRIQTKQTVRRQEYRLLRAELLGVMAALRGGAYPREALQGIRHAQFFTMFHDAITATHIDAAYEELRDCWKRIDAALSAVEAAALRDLLQPDPQAITVINPTGQASTQIAAIEINGQAPVALLDEETGQEALVLSQTTLEGGRSRVEFLASGVPGFGARAYRVQTARQWAAAEISQPPAAAVIANSRFRVQAGPRGIETIWDQRLGRAILTAGEYRPAELILEHDEGSPWATLSPDQRRTPLAPYTLLTGVERRPGLERLWFDVDIPREGGFSGKCLRARLSVTLVEGLERIDFHMTAWWDGFNHRLRVAMPLPFSGRHLYEVPYGMIERQPYEPWFRWAGANGDWPAINWAGVEGPGVSVALLNRGTPSYRIEAGQPAGEVILLSLLRSPAIPTYLHEPEFYTMTEYDGMRDMGEHAFDFAICAYEGAFSASSVVADADAYNAGLLAVQGRAELPPLPQVTAGPGRIAAVKWAESGHALAVRLVEHRGLGGTVAVALPPKIRAVEQVNLLERQGRPLEIENQSVEVYLRPWDIATLKLYPGL